MNTTRDLSPLVNATNQQIWNSVYDPKQPVENKREISRACDRIKTTAAVVAFAIPVFAFFLPVLTNFLVSAMVAVIAFEVFNIADNISDAARDAAQGHIPPRNASHIRAMLESTQVAKRVFDRWFA